MFRIRVGEELQAVNPGAGQVARVRVGFDPEGEETVVHFEVEGEEVLQVVAGEWEMRWIVANMARRVGVAWGNAVGCEYSEEG